MTIDNYCGVEKSEVYFRAWHHYSLKILFGRQDFTVITLLSKMLSKLVNVSNSKEKKSINNSLKVISVLAMHAICNIEHLSVMELKMLALQNIHKS